MKSARQLVEEIIRAKTALHLRLAADRTGGKLEIGGKSVDDMIAEVDAGLSDYEQMLVLFKNESAAQAMMEALEMEDEAGRAQVADPAGPKDKRSPRI